MGGYQTSDEMSGVASRVNVEVGPIGDEADAITRSQVSTADGGRDFGERAAAYADALRHNVIASIRSYGAATTALGGRLVDTYHRYLEAEADTAGSTTGSGNH